MVAPIAGRDSASQGATLFRQAALLCALALPHLSAQAQHIIGTVVASRSDEPLDGVTVVLVGTLFAAVTGPDGRFSFGPVAEGAYAVEASLVGFQTERRDVMLDSGDLLSLCFRLVREEKERAQDPMIITAPPTRDPLRAVALALPGVHAARRGGRDFAHVVRGLWGPQVGVVMDGLRAPPGSAYGFGAPLGAVGMAADVEVARGPYALTWGPGLLSAVRVRASAEPRSMLLLGYASNIRAYDAAGTWGGASDRLAYQIHGAYRAGRDYQDGGGQRQMADAASTEVSGRGSFDLGRGDRLTLAASYQDQRKLDAAGGLASGGTAQRSQASVTYRRAWTDRSLRSLDVAASWRQASHSLGQALHPFPLPASEQDQKAARVALLLAPSPDLELHIGGDFYSMLHGPSLKDVRVTQAGLFSQASRAWSRVAFSGAARLDVVRAAGAKEIHVSAAATASARLSPSWEATAGVGAVARTASAEERFAVVAPFWRAPFVIEVRGNEALGPERSLQADFGLRADYAKMGLRLDVFGRSIRGFIAPDLLALPQFINTMAVFSGGEAQARYLLLGEYAVVTASAAYVHGRNLSHEESARALPPATGSAGLRLAAPARLITLEIDGRGALREKAKRGEGPTPEFFVVDLRLGFRLPRGASMQLGIDNIAGSLYAYHVSGYGRNGVRIAEPGRIWFARIRYGL